MSDSFVGEIRMFAGNYAPLDWMFCEGQTLPIDPYQQLYALLGTAFGGDGSTNFKLPDLRGRIPVHVGGGLPFGSSGGAETVSLTADHVPQHTHKLMATSSPASTPNPEGALPATGSVSELYWGDPPADGEGARNLAAEAVSSGSGGQAHPNVQPFLCVNFIICVNGFFPTRD